MPLSDHIRSDFDKFDVVCKDDVMQVTEISEGKVYTVLGVLQGFYILVNDIGKIGKYYADRFIRKTKKDE